MKKRLLFLILMTLHCSCSKSNALEEESETPCDDKVIEKIQEPPLGRWKLKEISVGNFLLYELFGELPKLDYANHNVIFEFTADSVLTVTGDMEHRDMNWYIERGLVGCFDGMVWEGIHTYSYRIMLDEYRNSITFNDDKIWSFYFYIIKDTPLTIVISTRSEPGYGFVLERIKKLL